MPVNKKNIVLIVLVLVFLLLVAAGAYWWFFLRPKSEQAVVSTPAPATASVQPESQPEKRDLLEASTDKPFPFKSFEITVKDLQYSAGRISGYEDTAPQDQKLLLVTFTALNKNANPTGLGYITPWTVVDESGKRLPVAIVLDEATHTSAEGDVEPASVHTITAVFPIPANAKAASFFLDPNDGTPQTHLKIATPPKPLAAGFADPSELTGSNALPKIAASIGTTYPLSYPFDFSVDTIALASVGVNQAAPAEGKQFLALNLTFTNTTSKVQSVNSGSIALKIKDADGGTYDTSSLVKGSSDDDLAVEIDPGASIKARAFIEAPLKPALTTLTIQQPRGSGESRAFVYDLKALGTPPANPAANP